MRVARQKRADCAVDAAEEEDAVDEVAAPAAATKQNAVTVTKHDLGERNQFHAGDGYSALACPGILFASVLQAASYACPGHKGAFQCAGGRGTKRRARSHIDPASAAAIKKPRTATCTPHRRPWTLI